MTKIDTSGIYDIPLATYLGQPCTQLSIGASDVQLVTELTPKHLRQKWSEPRDFSKEAELGSVIHAMILEPHRSQALVEVIKGADDYKSPATRNKRDAARNAGKIPLLEKDLERAHGAVRAVQEDPIATELLSDGKAEQSWFAFDKEAGLVRKCRPDFYTSRRVIIDVKAVGSTAPDFISRRIDDGQWFMQAPWYLDVVERVEREPAHGYSWICVEHKPPYDVVVRKPTYAALMHGHRLNEAAVKLIAQCNRTGVWPGNGGTIQDADLPSYAYYRLEEDAVRAEQRGMEAVVYSRQTGASPFG